MGSRVHGTASFVYRKPPDGAPHQASKPTFSTSIPTRDTRLLARGSPLGPCRSLSVKAEAPLKAPTRSLKEVVHPVHPLRLCLPSYDPRPRSPSILTHDDERVRCLRRERSSHTSRSLPNHSLGYSPLHLQADTRRGMVQALGREPICRCRPPHRQ